MGHELHETSGLAASMSLFLLTKSSLTVPGDTEPGWMNKADYTYLPKGTIEMEKMTNRLRREAREYTTMTGVKVSYKCKTKNNFFHTLDSANYDYKDHDTLLKEIDSICEDSLKYLKTISDAFNCANSGLGQFWFSADDEMVINKEEVTEIWMEIGGYTMPPMN